MSAEAAPRCQNCGADAPAKFCPECGQSTDTTLPTLWGFLQEAVGAFFSYDHKLWATLRALLFRPGQLTVDYVGGKRVRYLAPFQLLLWLQALTFLAFQLYFNPAAGSSERQSRAVLVIGAFFAVTLALLHLRSGLRFILHFIAALHLWAFLMVLLLAEYILVPWGSVALRKLHLVQGPLPLGLYVTHTTELVMAVYITLALRRIYQSTLLVASFKTLLLLAAYLAFMKLFPFAAL